MTLVSPLSDQVAALMSVMVVWTDPLPATLAPVVLPGLDSADRILFVALHQAVVDRSQADHQVGHRAAGAGVGQRAGAGIEAQIGARADRRVHRRREARMVGAGGVMSAIAR